MQQFQSKIDNPINNEIIIYWNNESLGKVKSLNHSKDWFDVN